MRASQRSQAAGSTQQSDSQPFASLLDANAPPPPPPQPSTQPPSSPSAGATGNAPSATAQTSQSTPTTVTDQNTPVTVTSQNTPTTTGGAKPVHNANANSVQQSKTTGNGKPNDLLATSASSKQPAKATANPDATVGSTPAPAPMTSADTPPPSNNAPTNNAADQSGSAPSAATGTATAAANALNATVTNAGPPTETKAADKGTDKNGKVDVGAAAPNTSQSPSPANVQPVATAIVANSAAGSTPPAPATTETLSAIGGQAKPRAKATPPVGDDQDVQGQDATDDAADSSAAPPSSADDQNSTATASGSTGTPTAPTLPAADAQQAQVQADTTAILAQTEAAQASGGGGRAGMRADIAGATTAQGTAGATAPAAGGATALPNFGFVAANTLSPGATSAAASGTAVPLAGLAVAIASRAQAGSTQFDIRLDPPELGRIDVRLGVDGNGQATTHVTVDRPDTLQLLQNQQPQLQQALEQAGLKTADNGLQFTLRDQSFAGQNGTGNGSGQQNTTQLVIPDAELAPVDTTQIYSRWSRGSGLDIRV
jgi:flagellar hook-length control protein FliK